jgi:hypothetical protein
MRGSSESRVGLGFGFLCLYPLRQRIHAGVLDLVSHRNHVWIGQTVSREHHYRIINRPSPLDHNRVYSSVLIRYNIYALESTLLGHSNLTSRTLPYLFHDVPTEALNAEPDDLCNTASPPEHADRFGSRCHYDRRGRARCCCCADNARRSRDSYCDHYR